MKYPSLFLLAGSLTIAIFPTAAQTSHTAKTHHKPATAPGAGRGPSTAAAPRNGPSGAGPGGDSTQNNDGPNAGGPHRG